MVPTLLGRVQTRLFLLIFVGGVVTALLTPVLPLDGLIPVTVGALTAL